MAKKAKKAKKASGKSSNAGGRRGRSNIQILLVVCGIALVPFSIPTLLLLFAGLLPTLVAALTDRSLARYAWICVGGLNFAGLAPALLTLWFGHHEIPYAVSQLTSLKVLLMAYGGAAVGWMLYFAAPPVVGVILQATSQRRAESMRKQMAKLQEEWGDEVATEGEEEGTEEPPTGTAVPTQRG